MKKLPVYILFTIVASLGVLTSCDKEPQIIDNSWDVLNGVSYIEMTVGDSRPLPHEDEGKSCAWASDNEAVAIVIDDGQNPAAAQILKAVGVGAATIADANSKYKIHVTVKERAQ